MPDKITKPEQSDIPKRVLLINDLAVMGGTEVQHWREYDLLQLKGHEVFSLTFDEALPASGGPRYNIPIDENDIQKALTRTFGFRYKKRIKRVIQEVSPDVIHINNAVKAPLALYDCAAKYPCVHTIRDYSAICPKATCIHDDYSTCKGRQFEDCTKCGLTRSQRIKFSFMDRIDARCISCCDVMVSPSQALADACTCNGLPTICLNNPFDFNKIPERNLVVGKKIYLYYGNIAQIKGVEILLDAFAEFEKDKTDVELVFAGRIASGYEERFIGLLSGVNNAKYVGSMSNDEILKLLGTTYCVVVPSLWIENYPNTVLEPMASGVLVIGSNRGGIPEMIRDNKRLFDIQNTTSVVDCLNWTYDVDFLEYNRMVDESVDLVNSNNTLEAFYERLCSVFFQARLKR